MGKNRFLPNRSLFAPPHDYSLDHEKYLSGTYFDPELLQSRLGLSFLGWELPRQAQRSPGPPFGPGTPRESEKSPKGRPARGAPESPKSAPQTLAQSPKRVQNCRVFTRPFFLFAPFAGHPSSSPFSAHFRSSLLKKCSVLWRKGHSTELGERQFQDGPLRKVREGNSFPKSA